MKQAPIAFHSAGPSVEELLQFRRLLADLSTRFLKLPAAEIDAAITDALRNIVEHFQVDRCVLLRIRTSGNDANVTHSWARAGVPSVPPMFIANRFPWTLSRFLGGQGAMFSHPNDLPAEAGVDKASWERIGVRSHLSVPFVVAGGNKGAIALACFHEARAWTDDLVERVRLLATIFGNAIAHKRAREALDAAMDFERVTSDVLAALLTAARGEQNRVIVEGLRDMARVFDVEHVTLWERVRETSKFKKTHRWRAAGRSSAENTLGPVALPWICTELAKGSIVRFTRLADLPPGAASDLPRLRTLDIRAAVIVPLVVSRSVVGALSFATEREDHEWPDALVPRATLLGEVFASVIARQEAERREREAQEQAAHAARIGTMGAFAASLVHELTQPLAASLANAEMAKLLAAERAPDLDELRATIADVVSDDRRASDLIQQLRRFLRRGEAHRVELDLRALVEEVVRIVAGEASDKQITIALEIPDALPETLGDRVQIQQVLLNLILNAFEALATNAPGSRQVNVRARPGRNGVVIEVADNGQGMDESTLARVFQPFFSTKSDGMGLGLSISRTIVSAHGGTLSAQSTPGLGTTFRIELPSQQVQQPEASPSPRRTSRQSRAGTVYVIDDDPSMCRAIERQLQREGLKVETFLSAAAYLDRNPGDGVACIVSDVRMPGLSGLDLQASLARAERELPMVFISGHGDVATTVHVMKAGAVSFLPKPFTREALLAAVDEALARSRSRAAVRKQAVALKARYASLTPREREVFTLVADGLLNKSIADRLGAAEATVKVHRSRVMEKMNAASAADLGRMAERLARHLNPPSATVEST
jgi:FixJ family two-component response regulator/signal transduction histidine kinase